MYSFLLKQKIKNEEIKSLEDFIDSNPEDRELDRALAIKMAIQGQHSGATAAKPIFLIPVILPSIFIVNRASIIWRKLNASLASVLNNLNLFKSLFRMK
jgi:hypothetical protein